MEGKGGTISQRDEMGRSREGERGERGEGKMGGCGREGEGGG